MIVLSKLSNFVKNRLLLNFVDIQKYKNQERIIKNKE